MRVVTDEINVRPAIKIYHDKSYINNDDFLEVLLGIEEEGIPYEVYEYEEEDEVLLGYRASIDSIIGVGIGISKEKIVLHYNKLDKDYPLYKISIKSGTNNLRALGSNAARLVIKMPFKEIK